MNKQLAEVKLLKVGESLTGNTDGNPEPSTLEISKEACVETRREVCIKCKGVISLTKYKSSKFCSSRCRNAFNSYKYRVKVGLISKPGIGRGNNQTKSIEQLSAKLACKRALSLLPNICNRCNSKVNLLAHHIDHNRKNNKLENFEILCKRCHQEHHSKRDYTGKYIKG